MRGFKAVGPWASCCLCTTCTANTYLVMGRTSSYLPAERHKYCALRARSSQDASSLQGAAWFWLPFIQERNLENPTRPGRQFWRIRPNNVGSSKMLVLKYAVPRPCACRAGASMGMSACARWDPPGHVLEHRVESGPSPRFIQGQSASSFVTKPRLTFN